MVNVIRTFSIIVVMKPRCCVRNRKDEKRFGIMAMSNELDKTGRAQQVASKTNEDNKVVYINAL
jgi:hypothetical protein